MIPYKFSTKFRFRQKIRKSRFRSKISKISISAKNLRSFDFSENFRKRLNSVRMIGNLDFGQNFENIWFQLNISKIQNVGKFRYQSDICKISILIKVFEIVWFAWKKFLNLDFVQISKKFDFGKNFENMDFDANFLKKFDFGQKYRKSRFR